MYLSLLHLKKLKYYLSVLVMKKRNFHLGAAKEEISSLHLLPPTTPSLRLGVEGGIKGPPSAGQTENFFSSLLLYSPSTPNLRLGVEGGVKDAKINQSNFSWKKNWNFFLSGDRNNQSIKCLSALRADGRTKKHNKGWEDLNILMILRNEHPF